ncbi:MAG: hypothetical protein LBV58_01220 [Acholeplasmatales bacterium]|jgi:sporulation inhibitor KapD|nr:hypothetical protein [Acholeplasmatales bacterium]
MREIIYEIVRNNKYFYVIRDGIKECFYLYPKHRELIQKLLRKGMVMDFEVSEPELKNDLIFRPVKSISRIFDGKNNRILFDISDIRKGIIDILSSDKYYLFTDFEMTMPIYKGPFNAEIIEAGLILSKPKGEIILSERIYIYPKSIKALNRRTMKFLDLDVDLYSEHAVNFDDFYNRISEIIELYHPSFVVWGDFDYTTLLRSLQTNKKDIIIKKEDFINLLKIYKNFFSLASDVGLFKAYELISNETLEEQKHDALDDAFTTKKIFDKIVNYKF